MRRAAERVDDQMRAYMETQAIPGPWPARERLLVCIGPGTLSERLVRTTRRLADELKAEWDAVYVETLDHAGATQEQQDRVAHILRLAEELGAYAVNLPGRSVVETVLEYARRHNVTKIIVGKPLNFRWLEMLRGSVVDQLIHQSGPIDIYVVSGETETTVGKAVEAWRPHRPLGRYLWGVVLVAAATGLSVLIAPIISPTNLVVIYLLSVVLAAVYLGRGPAILTSFLSVVAFDFFLVPPHFTMAVADTEYLLTFLGLLVVGLIISQLTAQVREQAEAAQRREIQATALYELGRDLAVTAGQEAIAKTIIARISQTFSREVAIFLPKENSLKVFEVSPGTIVNDNELAVATWVFDHGQTAGRGTDTLRDATMRCMPLKTTRGVIGVLGVRPTDPDNYLSPDQRRTLDIFANQVALAIERARLAEQARQAELLEATEKLQTALLNSISHDLRTPLVSITGALSSLEEGPVMDEEVRHGLIQTGREEANRLNRLVGNLLDMTRLEAGALRVHKEASDVEDLIGSTLQQFGSRLDTHPVSVELPDDLPLVPVDFVLIEQVLINIVDNASKYSPEGSLIEINGWAEGGNLNISVADRGIGIPAEDLLRVFDKFYRVQRPDNVSGTGLGLSISKGIVEAHGGSIQAENRPGGGTVIEITLPLEEAE